MSIVLDKFYTYYTIYDHPLINTEKKNYNLVVFSINENILNIIYLKYYSQANFSVL